MSGRNGSLSDSQGGKMCNFCAEIQQWDWRFPNTGHFAQKTFCTSLLAQVLDHLHNS